MTPAEIMFEKLAHQFDGVSALRMFGWPCLCLGRKPFVFLDKDTGERLIFRLYPEEAQQALQLTDTEVFNPGGKSKRMKNWIVVGQSQRKQWPSFAEKSYQLMLHETRKATR
ncbi:MAG: hypothetical protein MUC38_14815 [Cyclobacteriaceae bacterium]|nr:hypothetical protein [Cyclobacteriaceae bacterium]